MAQSGGKRQGGGCFLAFLAVLAIALVIEYWEVALGILAAVGAVAAFAHFGQSQQWGLALGLPALIVVPTVILITAAGGEGEGSSGERAVEREVRSDGSDGQTARRIVGDSDGDGRVGETGESSGVRPDECCLTVTEVVDGDTIGLQRVGRVRLIGIDTPERGDCGYDEATSFTKQRIGGESVSLLKGQEDRDRYGRLLAYVYDSQGRMHNLELAENGYAKVLTIPPNDRYAGRFEAAVADAKRRYGSVPRGGCESKPKPAPASPAAPSAEQDDDSQPAPSGGGLPSPPPDLDCEDVGGPVPVGPSDPHDLDGNGDGIGCNS